MKEHEYYVIKRIVMIQMICRIINKPTLSDFTLLKVVGKGAFGKVLQLRKISNGEIYAIKILQKENVIKRNMQKQKDVY